MPFVEEFELLGCRFRQNVKGTHGTESTLEKVWKIRGGIPTSFERRVCGSGPSVNVVSQGLQNWVERQYELALKWGK